ncbi:MAG: glutamate--cysteine ligase [Burkholderiales bacterium RIFCSPLOWO2_12_FULL_64_99]|nr:MAG: glutamate--cysteine ligase [Burkholderiales bacterium RIFCSPLOWO2_12_FULL_64_99]
MSPTPNRLRSLDPQLLLGIRRGIEKESLRVRPDGRLAATPHPAALGSALTHARITTDFSESQLELITGVHASVESCLEELTRIHQAVYRAIGDEVLWCASMPCGLPEEGAIPLGRYGSSNLGRAKTVYRTGLSHRYGRRMQTISGIHYNFSLPEEAWGELPWSGGANAGYFALMRNFQRHGWLAFYLFGASPAVCPSFVAGRAHGLQPLAPGTLYLPHATTLRMGRLGYQSDAQSSLKVSYNSLESYADSLHEALVRPYPPYEAIGLREGDDYRQLSTSLLQIENEFYSKVRPKRVIRRGERPLHALRERGVEYVEVRLMDLDPFSPVGIDAPTMRLLDIFLLHCLLSDSPPDTPGEIAANARNQECVAARGRERDLQLVRGGQEMTLAQWGGQVLAECDPIAQALDDAAGQGGTRLYRDALAWGAAALKNPAAVPSARMLDAMAKRYANSYTDFVLAQSHAHRAALLCLPFPREIEAHFTQLAAKSIEEQRRIEAADTLPFEAFRRAYLAAETLDPAASPGRALSS